jgi:hypothetical protein
VNINLNTDRVLKAIKDNPISVLIVALFLIALMFAYLFNTERIRAVQNCDIELDAMKTEFTQYQIECNNEIINLRKDCRMKIDSIEDDYYRKFTNQERKLIKIEAELDRIKNKIE